MRLDRLDSQLARGRRRLGLSLLGAVGAAWTGLLLVVQRWGTQSARSDGQADEDQKSDLSVRLQDLKMAFSLAEVEAREKVFDPLGAVPDVPFGHFYPLWADFVQRVQEGDQVFSYEALRTSPVVGADMARGYALVREQRVVWVLELDRIDVQA